MVNALIFLFLFVTSAFAQAPAPEQVAEVAARVRAQLEAFSASPSKGNLNLLQAELQAFKGLIELADKTVDSEKGGAATPKAVDSVRAVGQFGVDIADALFAYRAENGEILDKKGLEQGFEDMMVNDLEYPLLSMAFRVMRHKVDERNPDGRVTAFEVFRGAIVEVGRDLANFFSGGRNRVTGEAYYQAAETIRRERAIRELLPLYRQMAQKQIPDLNQHYDGDLIYNRENHAERLGGLLLYLTDRAVNIRVERNTSQKYATVFYAASGALLAQPIFNFAGDSYTAHLETSIVIAATFATITALKRAMSSVRSTAEWVQLNREIRGEMAKGLVESTEIFLKKTFPKEYHPAQIPKWVDRRIAVRKAVTGFLARSYATCEGVLTDIKSRVLAKIKAWGWTS